MTVQSVLSLISTGILRHAVEPVNSNPFNIKFTLQRLNSVSKKQLRVPSFIFFIPVPLVLNCFAYDKVISGFHVVHNKTHHHAY